MTTTESPVNGILAAGLPVVATRIEGLSEIVVDGESGILVPAEDPEALAQALGALLADPDARRRMGEQGRARVREHFSRERYEGCVLAAYAGLGQPAPGREASRP